MEKILSRRGRQVLQQFAWSNVMLAFDYDGTLAPIVPDPDRAIMRPATRRLVKLLTRLYPSIIVSGRAGADAARFVRGLGFVKVIGNHGLETGRNKTRMARQVASWQPVLQSLLGGRQGIVIENKGLSVSVHYRQSRAKAAARLAIAEAAVHLGPARIIAGKQVVNILPQGAPHKGVAVEKQREQLRCDTVIYFGDDHTDEDVFAVDQPGRLLTIRVGASATSQATFFVRSQDEIDEVIRTLLGCRTDDSRKRTSP